jgi:hypothetical protein
LRTARATPPRTERKKEKVHRNMKIPLSERIVVKVLERGILIEKINTEAIFLNWEEYTYLVQMYGRIMLSKEKMK